MAWIEYHTSLREHWKIQRFADILEVDYVTALGAISCLWLWAAEYAQNGDISKFSDSEICSAMRFNFHAKVKNFTLEVLKKSFLIDGSGKIHDWGKHGIKLLKSSRKRQKAYRKTLRNGNVTVASFLPYHTIPNHSNIDTKVISKDKGYLSNISNIIKIEVVREYFVALNAPETEADKFFDYFTANGWKVGGRAPMKDWKAAARNWVRNCTRGFTNKNSISKQQNNIIELEKLNQEERIKNNEARNV